MEKRIITAVLIAIFLTPAIFAAQTESIRITKITDGDTVKGIVNGKEISIRLSGIDCYETSKRDRAYKQAYLNKMTIEEVVQRGKDSKEILTNLLRTNNNITVQFTDIDKRYKRNVGILYAGEVNVNEYMMQKGGCMCFEYKN